MFRGDLRATGYKTWIDRMTPGRKINVFNFSRILFLIEPIILILVLAHTKELKISLEKIP
jgi:hypothetical protein